MTVTLDDPELPAELDLSIELIAAIPADKPPVTLPNTTPNVTDALRVPCNTSAARHRTADSDTHSLASQLLQPDRAAVVESI